MAAIEKTENGSLRATTASRLIICATLWVSAVALWGQWAHPTFSYASTEWLPNYSGGFVRRGLGGEFLYWFTGLTQADPKLAILIAQCALSCMVFGVVFTLVWRARSVLGALPSLALLTSPLLLFPILVLPYGVDSLFILTTVAHLWVLRTEDDRAYILRAFWLFAVLGTGVVMIHEGFLLLSLPLNVILSLRRLGRSRYWSVVEIYLVPAVACLIMAAFHGNDHNVEAIRNAWASRGLEIPSNNAVKFLSWNLGEELSFSARTVALGQRLNFVALSAICILPLLFILKQFCRQAGSEVGVKLRREIWQCFWLPFFISLPLYLIGIDWNRWLVAVLGSSAIYFLSRMRYFPPLKLSKTGFVALAVMSAAGLVLAIPHPLQTGTRAVFSGPLSQSALDAYQLATRQPFGSYPSEQ